ncbi:MAG: DNA repair protein RecN [Candidatus Fimimonas sp.]
MIKNISIKNIALIDQVEIDFSEGLTVLSGETGSGKSIIVDSLSFVLGDRADKTLIKHGEEAAEVTALFEAEENAAVLNKLEEYGYGRDCEILISRKMSVSGKNEIRIQGKTATLAILKEVCGELVDIFGQGQHLALLNEKNQLSVLDSFCNFGEVPAELSRLWHQLVGINRELKAFGGNDAERERLADILKFQIDEIEGANLDEAEEEQLLAMHKRMVNAEKIAQALSQAVQCLNGENGAINQISFAADSLRAISNVEESADALSQRLHSCRLEADDVCATLEDLLESVDFSPAEADKLEERLEQIKTVKRKYGGTIKDALQFLQNAQAQYDNLTHSTEKIAKLTSEKHAVLQEMYSLAQKKSAERKRTAEILAKRIMGELDDLGMKGTHFEVSFAPQPTFDEYSASPSADGLDKVSFLMSANLGEPLKPLAKVISGGEMSRFMLAVKNITAQAERIPTMVFDEIDTGISGAMAQKVANKLANVSANKAEGFQCIVITHLPQIVAMSDVGLVISKIQQEGRTKTVVTQLQTLQQRAQEVARLMGGVGEHALLNAQELLEFSQKYKQSLL